MDCFIIVDGGFVHVFFLAFLAEHHIFCGKSLEKFLLLFLFLVFLCDDILQMFVLCSQLIHNVQFLAQESLGDRLFNIITTVDGEEEVIQGSLHVALVEGYRGIVILSVCLALLQCVVDDVVVIVLSGKLLDLISHKHLVVSNRFLQTDTLQACAARQPHPIFLAPMEDVTDIGFRLLCKRYGASMVYTEFVSAEALVCSIKSTVSKLTISDEERPVGIQIYGRDVDAMVEAAKIVEQAGPDVIDINFGCPVKKVAGKGAGAGMLQNIPLMLEITEKVVKAVKTPVTVKTRLGWSADNLVITTLAEQLPKLRVPFLPFSTAQWQAPQYADAFQE